MGVVGDKIRTGISNMNKSNRIQHLEKKLGETRKQKEIETDEKEKAILAILEARLITEITELKYDINLNNADLEQYASMNKLKKKKIDDKTYKDTDTKWGHIFHERIVKLCECKIVEYEKWIEYEKMQGRSYETFEKELESTRSKLEEEKKILEQSYIPEERILQDGINTAEDTRIGKVNEQAQTIKARQQEKMNPIEKDTNDLDLKDE